MRFMIGFTADLHLVEIFFRGMALGDYHNHNNML